LFLEVLRADRAWAGAADTPDAIYEQRIGPGRFV